MNPKLPERFLKSMAYQHEVEKVFKEENNPEMIISVLCCTLNSYVSDLENPEEEKKRLIEKFTHMPLI